MNDPDVTAAFLGRAMLSRAMEYGHVMTEREYEVWQAEQLVEAERRKHLLPCPYKRP